MKVRHGGGTWRLSDRDAGSLRRAGVKCHSLSGGNAAGIWEITGTSPLFSFSNAPPFILFLFSSFPFLRFVLPVLSLLLRLPSLSSHFYPFPFLPSLYSAPYSRPILYERMTSLGQLRHFPSSSSPLFFASCHVYFAELSLTLI